MDGIKISGHAMIEDDHVRFKVIMSWIGGDHAMICTQSSL